VPANVFSQITRPDNLPLTLSTILTIRSFNEGTFANFAKGFGEKLARVGEVADGLSL
jgi:hypothetical protein